MTAPRRVVTGLDSEGRSGILFDDSAGNVIWTTAESPADNSGTADAGGGEFVFPATGTMFVYFDFPPGAHAPMHATDTTDYLFVVSGEVTFMTETGRTVVRAGDAIVDRGHLHAWHNHTDEVCRIVNVLCAARPVGAGATTAGIVRDINRTITENPPARPGSGSPGT